MNTTKRYLLGLVSSLLLAVGLVRAADRLDPMVGNISVPAPHTLGVAQDSAEPCADISDLS